MLSMENLRQMQKLSASDDFSCDFYIFGNRSRFEAELMGRGLLEVLDTDACLRITEVCVNVDADEFKIAIKYNSEGDN